MTTLDHRLDRLERRLAEVAHDLQLVRTVLARDPASTLNKVRYITEGVMLRLCKEREVSWGKAEPTLENMLGPLVAHGVVPKNVGIHLRTIQSNASPGSHFQETPLTASHVQIALLALVDVLEWVLDGQVDRSDVVPAGRAWVPRVVHPLQPARHFAGRGAILERLRAWWRGDAAGERVMSIVAVGGTGKTALVERLVGDRAPAGVFVWSFYEDQRTESLLGEALGYFGIADTEVGGRLERLRAYLATTAESHAFVFDGLEAIQSSGGTGKLRGRIEDASVRLLVRSLAAGLGRTRLLVTSRARLVDLEDWADRGYTTIDLDDLDREATRAVLRGWGVRGDDDTLDRLHDHAGGHALSVAVLGSYLAAFCDGDPGGLAALELDTIAEDDPLAARLARLLDRYAEALPADELDLLVRLAAFPRGADLTLLGFLAGDPVVAGKLAGVTAPELQRLLARLVKRGLVYASRATGATYSAHPFLRQHFKRLLGVPQERVHFCVRAGLAPTLTGTPHTTISDPVLLDRYEQMIEHTRLAGMSLEAVQMFQRTLGGYMILGPTLGENVRGSRIATGLLDDPRTGVTSDDAPETRAMLCNQAALFAQALGDSDEARRLYESAIAQSRPRRTSLVYDGATENLADLERIAGRLPRALELVRGELDHRGKSPTVHAVAGHVFQLAGFADEAARCLARGDRPIQDPLVAIHRGAQLLRAGSHDAARSAFETGQALAEDAELKLDVTRCRIGLGFVELAYGNGTGATKLELARAWAMHSGHVETIVRCHELAATSALATADHDTATREVTDGMRLADSAGFGLYRIDLAMLAARIATARGAEAEARLHVADARARATVAGYVWAITQLTALWDQVGPSRSPK